MIELEHGRVKGTHPDGPPVAGRSPAARFYGAGRLSDEDFDTAVSVRELSKVFPHHGADVVHALEAVSFEARPGEIVGLVGRSGSGKTTLLNVIAGWEQPTSGEVRWRERIDPRSPSWSTVAAVPQKLGLMEELTVEENVEYPARLARSLEERRDEIEDLIGVLGIGELGPDTRGRPPWASSSGRRSPGRWPSRRACCSPTSPRRIRTRRRRAACSRRSARRRMPGRRSWSPRITRRSSGTSIASSRWPTGTSGRLLGPDPLLGYPISGVEMVGSLELLKVAGGRPIYLQQEEPSPSAERSTRS